MKPKQMSQSAKNKKSWSQWHERLHKRLKQNESLLPKNSTLLLAVSGGQDSMALLKLIVDLKRLHQWKIEVWHGNHQWHSKAKKIEEELKVWCKDREIEFNSTQANKSDVNNEKKARDWRYQHLTKRAQSLSSQNHNFPCLRILTGHTATDRAETILMNLARGADLVGLSSLKEKRKIDDKNIQLIRPLLIFQRKETSEICKEFNLPIWIDPSNENLNLARNKIRKEVLPVLNLIHKGADLRIAALANRLESYSEDQIIFAKIALEVCKGEKNNFLSRKKIIKFPDSIRKTMLNQWLKDMGVRKFTALQIEEINYKISLKKPPGVIDLHGGFLLIWDKANIGISNQNR